MRKTFYIALLCLIATVFLGMSQQDEDTAYVRHKKRSAKVVATTLGVVQPTGGNFWGVTGSGCGIFGSNPTTCAYPSNVTNGNGIYIHIIFGTTGTLATPTASGTATVGTISAVGSGCNAATTACGGAQQWYHASITGGGTLTISDVPPSSNNMSVLVWEVSQDGGADSGTNPVYAYNNTGCTTGCSIVSITPATSGDLIICDGHGSNTATISAVTPYTLIGQDAASGNNLTIWAVDEIVSSTSTVSGTYTTSVADNTQNGCIAIK